MRELAKRSAAAFSTGEVYCRYHFGKTLGKGIFSTVIEGVDKHSGEHVAIKVIQRPRTMTVKQACILMNEVDILRAIATKIKHPNLCRVLSVYGDAARVFIVMKLCTGGELFERLSRVKRFTEKGASQLVKKLASALAALHAQDIIHRDLKPENVLYTSAAKDAEPMLSDFGLSMFRGVDYHGTKVGSPAYVAPEVLAHGTYTPACDVWALGVIAYILLVGFPPFYGDNDQQMFRMILSGRVDFPSPYWDAVSRPARDLVTKMLTFDHTRRISASQVLEHPFIRDHHAAAELPHMRSNLSKLRARRRFRAAGLATILGARMRSHATLRSLLAKAKLTEAQLRRLRTSFVEVGNGNNVTLPQFERVMKGLGFYDLPLHRMFAVFDTHRTGTVDFRELLVGLCTLKSSGDERALQLVFQVYDADGTGYISREELAGVLRALVTNSSTGDMEEDDFLRLLNTVFESLDIVGDNRISFAEFQQGVTSNPVLFHAFVKPAERIGEASDSSETAPGRAARAAGGVGRGAGSGGGGEGGGNPSGSARPHAKRRDGTSDASQQGGKRQRIA